MLVLSRKNGEQLIVSVGGENVIVQIVKISGSRVRIGVQASPGVAVRRAELLQDVGADHRGQAGGSGV